MFEIIPISGALFSQNLWDILVCSGVLLIVKWLNHWNWLGEILSGFYGNAYSAEKSWNVAVFRKLLLLLRVTIWNFKILHFQTLMLKWLLDSIKNYFLQERWLFCTFAFMRHTFSGTIISQSVFRKFLCL